jgi:hypothetical protein
LRKIAKINSRGVLFDIEPFLVNAAKEQRKTA